jgi:hypothetical protein
MESVSVAALKTNLSRYLEAVKKEKRSLSLPIAIPLPG